ncbi:MAG: baseplate J/gp47 family protein, partial [Thermomicrobiales bacterium]|nr:baseplate J/gp47 family protein [Thermomicrobiales bacterium]
RRTPTVVVREDESLSDVLNRLRAAARSGHTVHLVVPVESPLLLTASEFRTLQATLDDEGLPVVVRTADPLRLKLGERLGLTMQAAPRRKRPAPAALVLAPPPSPPEIVEPEEAAYTGPDPALLWPGQVTEAIEAEEEPDSSPEPGRRNPPRRWLPAALLLVLLLIGGAFLFRALTPQVVVRYVPRTEAVSAAIVVDATADGQPLDDDAAFAFATQQQQVDVVWSGATTATGTETVPDQAASGAIELRNAGATPLTVDAGTVVATESGVEFTFTEAIEVPAADAASGEPGAATGQVVAVSGGTSGNVGTGEIGGRLPNGVYYSNRMEPTTGGTDQEFRVVTEGDLDLLLAEAVDAVDGLAEAAVNGDEGDQGFVVTRVTILQQGDTFDHQAGDRADEVSLDAAMTLEVTVVDLQQAEGDFERELANELTSNAPPGFTVPVKEMLIDPPVVQRSEERGVRLQIVADVEARLELDETQQRALAKALGGLTPAEAAAVLAEDPAIVAANVQISPGWLISRVPENPDRVTFEAEK